MLHLERLKQVLGFRQNPSRNLREKFAAITELVFGGQSHEKTGVFRMAFLSLVHPLLVKNGQVDENAKGIYRRLLEEYFNFQIAETHIAELTGISPLDKDTAVKNILETAPDKAVRTAEFLITLTVSLGGDTGDIRFVREVSLNLGMSAADFSAFLRKSTEDEMRKRRVNNSRRGIIAALIIIAIFFLTAKYLQSVIFGLLLACILLPMERFFERRLRRRKGICFLITRFGSALAFPLKKLSLILTRKNDDQPENDMRNARSKEMHTVKQAMLLTVISALLITGAAIFGISKLTGHYMHDLQSSIKQWEQERLMSNNGDGQSRTGYVLDKLRSNFESLPIIQHAIDRLGRVLKNPEFRQQMIDKMYENGHGIFGVTSSVLSGMVSFLCDILLTVFFAMLFLFKFAEFSAQKDGKVSGSEYIVRNFFNGIWLPGADENLIQDTCRIIRGILSRLRIWLKGYITLIMVDSTVYTICFFFLGVPFFLPLGLIAGCGIALPYLGPVISCALTLLVTIAVGGATGEMLLAVIICYLIYNGIIEQFILYPAVIGDSLGLSTLETIIVVLLGAIVAGIPGMIFSLPTASVAKFIIPQIYHGFYKRKPLISGDSPK